MFCMCLCNNVPRHVPATSSSSSFLGKECRAEREGAESQHRRHRHPGSAGVPTPSRAASVRGLHPQWFVWRWRTGSCGAFVGRSVLINKPKKPTQIYSVFEYALYKNPPERCLTSWYPYLVCNKWCLTVFVYFSPRWAATVSLSRFDTWLGGSAPLLGWKALCGQLSAHTYSVTSWKDIHSGPQVRATSCSPGRFSPRAHAIYYRD